MKSLKETLLKFREELEEIGGGWDGENSKYIVGGEVYCEEDATAASDGVELIDSLLEIIDHFYA